MILSQSFVFFTGCLAEPLHNDDSALLSFTVQDDDSAMLSVRGRRASSQLQDEGVSDHQLALTRPVLNGKSVDNDALDAKVQLVQTLAFAAVNETIKVDDDLKKTLSSLYQDLMNSIDTTHAEQQQDLRDAETAVGVCVGKVGHEHEYGGLNEWGNKLEEVRDLNETHTLCRKSLVEQDETVDSACNQLFELEKKIKEELGAAPAVKESEFTSTLGKCSTEDPVDAFPLRNEVEDFFSNMKSVESAWQSAKTNCDKARAKVADIGGTCNEHQEELEHEACSYKASCLAACHEKRTACLGTAVDAWESLKDSAILNSEERKIAWVSADQIRCFVGVLLMEENEGRKDELLKCLNKEYDLSGDTAHLTIEYKHRDEVIPDPDCHCQAVHRPGSHEWSKMYAGIASTGKTENWGLSCANRYKQVQECTLADELLGLETVSWAHTKKAKYWKLHIVEDGKGTDHVCYDLFRFVREDGSFGEPLEVVMQGSGNKYDQNRVNHVFNFNGVPGGYHKNHWCIWHHDASVTMRFAQEEEFSDYLFTLHGRNCAYWPKWEILKSNDGEQWEVVTKEDDNECSNGRGHSNGEWSKFSLVRADQPAQVTTSKNWRMVWTWMRHDHTCYDLFRFRRVDGTYGAPKQVVAWNHGKRQYDSGHRDRTFNVNNQRPGLQQDHFCMWGVGNKAMVGDDEPQATITFQFEEEESFSHYLMTFHGENCHYWNTWELQTSDSADPFSKEATWKTVTENNDQKCPHPLPVRNEMVITPPVHAHKCGFEANKGKQLTGAEQPCIDIGERTLEEAQEWCLQNPECEGFNWRDDAKHHTCWFKNLWWGEYKSAGNNDAYELPCRKPAAQAPVPAGTECGSGGIIEIANEKWEYYTWYDCGGRDLHYENNHQHYKDGGKGPAWSINKCAEQCNGRDRCSSFNWRHDGNDGGCYQKHDFFKSIVLAQDCGGKSNPWDFYTRVPPSTPATCNTIVPRKDGKPNQDGVYRAGEF